MSTPDPQTTPEQGSATRDPDTQTPTVTHCALTARLVTLDPDKQTATVTLGALTARIPADALWPLADAATDAASRADEARPVTSMRCVACGTPVAYVRGRTVVGEASYSYQGRRGPLCTDETACSWRVRSARTP